jgi:hypothetical protein
MLEKHTKSAQWAVGSFGLPRALRPGVLGWPRRAVAPHVINKASAHSLSSSNGPINRGSKCPKPMNLWWLRTSAMRSMGENAASLKGDTATRRVAVAAAAAAETGLEAAARGERRTRLGATALFGSCGGVLAETARFTRVDTGDDEACGSGRGTDRGASGWGGDSDRAGTTTDGATGDGNCAITRHWSGKLAGVSSGKRANTAH